MVRRPVALALLTAVALAAPVRADENLPAEGKYVLGVSISGIEEGTVVLSNCTVAKKDGAWVLSLKDRYNDKFTLVYSESTKLMVADGNITFTREYRPTPMAHEERGKYTEWYTGRVRTKTGFIGGTVTGRWEKDREFAGRWILIKVPDGPRS